MNCRPKCHSLRMSTPNISYHTYCFTVYFSSAASGQKKMSRRKKYLQINNFNFIQICCPVLCERECLQFMFISVSKLNNKGFLDCTFTGQAWSSNRLFAQISCRFSPRGHKLHICVSVMRARLHVANLMTIAMLLCAHRQVRLCSVHMSPIFCVCCIGHVINNSQVLNQTVIDFWSFRPCN